MQMSVDVGLLFGWGGRRPGGEGGGQMSPYDLTIIRYLLTLRCRRCMLRQWQESARQSRWYQ